MTDRYLYRRRPVKTTWDGYEGPDEPLHYACSVEALAAHWMNKDTIEFYVLGSTRGLWRYLGYVYGGQLLVSDDTLREEHGGVDDTPHRSTEG